MSKNHANYITSSINDYADRDFDKYVLRTKERPLTSGKISKKEAISIAVGLALIAFLLIQPRIRPAYLEACPSGLKRSRGLEGRQSLWASKSLEIKTRPKMANNGWTVF